MTISARQLASNDSQEPQGERIGTTPLSWTLVLPVLAVAAWLLSDVVQRIVVEQHRDLPTLPPPGAAPALDLLPGAGEARTGGNLGDLFSSSDETLQPGPPLPDRNPQAPLQGPGTALPVSALPATLVGTITASDPTWSLALISEPGQPRAAPYRPGDGLAPGAHLVSVHADRVVIEHTGRLEVLWLDAGGQAPPGVVVAAADPLANPAGVDWIESLGPDRFRIERNHFTEILTHPERLAREARITLSFGQDGTVDGVRLAGIRPNGLLAQLGLSRADVIRRVNGAPLDGPDRMLEIIAALRSAREVELEIGSGGRTRTLAYRID